MYYYSSQAPWGLRAALSSSSVKWCSHMQNVCLVSVLALLVDVVHSRDRGRGVNEDDLGAGDRKLCEGADDEEHEMFLKELALAFFLHKVIPHPNATTQCLVIALRGTLLNRRGLNVDKRTGLEHGLRKGERIKHCPALIEKVMVHGGIQTQSRRIGQLDLLGAWIALLVGKDLVLSAHKIHIETHLFNPPMLTLASIAIGEVLPAKSTEVQQPSLGRKVIVGALKHGYVKVSDQRN
jgi:hypothetical protein